MMSFSVSIDVEKFEELIRHSERIEVIRRLKTINRYVIMEDVLTILCIDDPYKKEAKEHEDS